jgi:hypothetical protein
VSAFFCGFICGSEARWTLVFQCFGSENKEAVMSNKTPENKYELGTSSGQSDEVKSSSSSDFFEPCTSFVMDNRLNQSICYQYPVDYKSGRMVVTYFSSSWRTTLLLKMNPPLYSRPITVRAPTLGDGWTWDGYPDPGAGSILIQSSYNKIHVGKLHPLTFTSPGTSSLLELFIAPNDLTRYAFYKLNGNDQGGQDLLLYYNDFYSLEIYNPEDENYKFIETSKIKSISYDKDAPYSIDFIEDEELVENESGDSSIEGLSSAKNKAAKMIGGVKGMRIRYKNPDNPYFGPINVTLNFKEGMVLKPPIEVVKRVDV